MKATNRLLLACLAGAISQALLLTSGQGAATAQVTTTGDVQPAIPPEGGLIPGPITVGDTGQGSLDVIGGVSIFTDGDVTFGAQAGSVGTGTLSGPGTVFATTNAMFVGYSGNGTLSLTDGAIVSSEGYFGVADQAGSQGAVTLDGQGTGLSAGGELHIGNLGTGTLTLTGGANATVTGNIGVGDNVGAQGTVSLTGSGTSLNANGAIYVAYAGGGSLNLGAGAVTTAAGDVSVGDQAGATGTVSLTGASTSLTAGGTLYVGASGNGTLSVADSATATAAGVRIGEQVGSIGTAELSGPGTSVVSNGSLSIGNFGNGTLRLTDGAVITASDTIRIGDEAGSQGVVTLTGAGTVLSAASTLGVGNYGSGTMELRDGATVTVNDTSRGVGIGIEAGAQGNVTLTGVGTALTSAGPLAIGTGGNGMLTVTAGASASADITYIGVRPDGVGSATLSGQGSALTASSGLYVGFSGTGTLNLADGATATAQGQASVGDIAGANGTVTLTGAGTTLSANAVLLIGNGGSASMRLADGASLASGGALVLASQAGSQGELILGGSAGSAPEAPGTVSAATLAFGQGTGRVTFNHSSAAYTFAPALSGTGTLDQLAGTTILTGAGDAGGIANVQGGTLLVEGTLGNMATTVSAGARLGGSGTLGGDVVVHDGGSLAPGSSAGTLTVGSLALSGGSLLDFELGQAGVAGGGVNDLIVVNGNLTLDGTLAVTDIGGFGAGVYRLMNYGGALTDNGLEFGTLPSGSDPRDVFLQTGIAGQVNLVNSTGLALTFWDGANATQHNNGAIDGGSGVWDANNDNWSVADGAVNGRWDDGQFAVFGGAGGNVDVIGEHAVAGIQFMSAYTLAAGAGGGLRIDGADSVIRVDPGITAQIGAPIAGNGGLVKTDTGTLVLSGANTYGGGTRIERGTLQVAGDGNLGNAAGALSFNGGALRNSAAFASGRAVNLLAGGGTIDTGADLTLSGAIAGTGALTKSGAGTLILSGNSSYAGNTSINAGTLRVDGSLGGSTAVAAGARLTGTGTLGSVTNAGTVAAGNSIGTMAMTGDYTHRSGATLEVEIEPGGRSDLLDVAGRATLEGGTVNAIKAPGQYAGGTRYTLIDANGGVAGTFAALTQNSPFLSLQLAYDPNHVYLDVVRSAVSFASVCGGGFNRCQVAGGLDRIAQGMVSPDLTTVLNALTTLDADGVRASFDRLSGEGHASLAGAVLEGHALYGQTVTRRLADRREAIGAERLQGGVWARGYGSRSEIDGDGNAHGADIDLYGLAVGADAWATESWLIGASLNTASVDADFRAGDNGKADVKNVALYTSVQDERGYIDAVASYAWWDAEVQRRIEIGDTLRRNARSDYGMHRFAAYVEAGLSYRLGSGTLQPLLGAEWSLLSSDRFRETGAGDVGLIGSSQNLERTVASAGLRWSGDYGAGAWTVTPTVEGRWLHTFGDRGAEFDVAFTGAPQAEFRVRGVEAPKNRGLVSVGFQARRDVLDLFADLNYQAGDGFKAASLGAGLRWRW